MILHSSAITAALLAEPSAKRIGHAIGAAEACSVGAPTLLEAAMLMTIRGGDVGRLLLQSFIYQWSVDVLSVTEEHWQAARSAFVRFGKGRHPAALNFGDCLTYAVADVSGEPLLCIGNGFRQTDLELVEF